jgi:DNA-binding NarL/FixJ family response regulator
MRWSGPPVQLASSGEDDMLFRGMETGASAFVSKLAATPEIVSAIRHFDEHLPTAPLLASRAGLDAETAQPSRSMLDPPPFSVGSRPWSLMSRMLVARPV